MRNKLLEPEQSLRCTGRTTALVLDGIARALSRQGHHVYVADHEPGLNAARSLRAAIISTVEALGLKFFTIDVVESHGQYNNHVRIRSDIWEK